jgi:hypothetical protein
MLVCRLDCGCMKTTRVTVLLVSLAAAANLSAQTLTGFGVIKTSGVTQTANGTSTATGAEFSAYVFGSSLSGTYSVTPPAGGAVTTAQNLSINGGGANFSVDYADVSTMNAAYGAGVYHMELPNGGSPTSWDLQSLTGDAYPNAPLVTGTWSGGLLQVDPTQNYLVTFDAFGGFTANDSISMKIDGIGTNYFANTSVNTFMITAGTLTAGQTYDVSLRFNNNFIDYSAIGSANANAGFTTENMFQIQAIGAIPEPSTYAALLGAAALAGVMIQRRRRLA